jgi:hypothetical protein
VSARRAPAARARGTSDGRWCAAISLPSGRRKVVHGDTERAAIKARRDLLAEIDAGRPLLLGRTPTLGDRTRRGQSTPAWL